MANPALGAPDRGGDLGFERAHDIEEHLGSGFDGVQDGERVSVPCSDYESIRAAMNPEHDGCGCWRMSMLLGRRARCHAGWTRTAGP